MVLCYASHHTVVLVSTSLTTSDGNHLFMYLVIIALEKMASVPLPTFLKGWHNSSLESYESLDIFILIFYHLWFINKLVIELSSLNIKIFALYLYLLRMRIRIVRKIISFVIR